MRNASYAAFALLAYGVFLLTFLYLIAFVAGLPIVPYTVDTGGPAQPPVIAACVDLALILIFACQHSVMARPGFKRVWTRIVPPPVERSAYVLATSLALILLFALWRPIGHIIWSVDQPVAAALLWALSGLGWGIVLLSTFLISHFELFGLKQVWLHARRQMAAHPVLRQPLFYRWVRHPLYTGFFIAFWATPHMSMGHLLLAGALSAFMLIAIQLEERDLVDMFGQDYVAYRRTTGMLFPRLRGD
jgi:protein-S-isoprenylcysteine O-methyltransferase Ste14